MPGSYHSRYSDSDLPRNPNDRVRRQRDGEERRYTYKPSHGKGLDWRGSYETGVYYRIDDVVEYNSDTYVFIYTGIGTGSRPNDISPEQGTTTPYWTYLGENMVHTSTVAPDVATGRLWYSGAVLHIYTDSWSPIETSASTVNDGDMHWRGNFDDSAGIYTSGDVVNHLETLYHAVVDNDFSAGTPVTNPTEWDTIGYGTGWFDVRSGIYLQGGHGANAQDNLPLLASDNGMGVYDSGIDKEDLAYRSVFNAFTKDNSFGGDVTLDKSIINVSGDITPVGSVFTVDFSGNGIQRADVSAQSSSFSWNGINYTAGRTIDVDIIGVSEDLAMGVPVGWNWFSSERSTLLYGNDYLLTLRSRGTVEGDTWATLSLVDESIDHGSLTGRDDDDHGIYLTTGRADTWIFDKVGLDHLDEDLGDIQYVFNGICLDSPLVIVSGDGASAWAIVERNGGGDIRVLFTGGVHDWNTTPADSVEITVGSDSSPQINYIYFQESTNTLTGSTVDFPNEQHAPIATVFAQSATGIQDDGPYKVHSWTDHVDDIDHKGHLQHLNYWVRTQPATWTSGIVATLTITPGSPDTLTYTTTAGVVLQLHQHNFPAFTGTPSIHVTNHPDADYTVVTDLADLLIDANGDSLTNRAFSIVIWGVVSEATGDCKLFCNLSSGSYSTVAGITSDSNKYANYTIPKDFKGVGFLISELKLSHSSAGGGSWTEVDHVNLLGLFPAITAGAGSVGSTEFVDNVFKILNNTDTTKAIAFEAAPISTATTRTITMPDNNVHLGEDYIASGDGWNHINDDSIHVERATAFPTLPGEGQIFVRTDISEPNVYFYDVTRKLWLGLDLLSHDFGFAGARAAANYLRDGGGNVIGSAGTGFYLPFSNVVIVGYTFSTSGAVAGNFEIHRNGTIIAGASFSHNALQGSSMAWNKSTTQGKIQVYNDATNPISNSVVTIFYRKKG